MKKRIVIVLSGIALLAGCNKADQINGAPGDYEGYVASLASGQSQQTLVIGKLTSATARKTTTLSLHIQAIKGGPDTWDFSVRINGGKLSLNDVRLPKPEGNCYVGNTDKNHPTPAARLCYDGHELALDWNPASGPSETVILDRIDPTKEVQHVTPKTYTAADIIEQAIDQNFNSQIQFESVVQAKLNAQQAAALLLPHLSASDIQTAVFSGWSTLLNAVGDLLPFVFLDRDFQAKEAELQYQAAAETLTIEKADAGNIAEGLTYMIDRDTRMLAAFNLRLPILKGIAHDIQRREVLGMGMPAGSSDDITSIANSVEQSISGLQLTLAEKATSLALTAGMRDPNAISAVEPSNTVSIDNPQELDETTITSVANQLAHETKQIDILKRAAHWDKWSRMTSWYDPSGATGSAIGVNLIPFINVSFSEIRQLDAQRNFMIATITNQVDTAIKNANQALADYLLAKEAVDIQQRRVDRTLKAMELDEQFTLADLSSALQSQITADVSLLNAECTYYLSISTINRLEYAGPYGRLASAANQSIPKTSGNISLK